MPLSHIRHIAFLVPGNFDDDDPAQGLEDTLGLIELGERLGYDSAWVRQRHLERGISSAATFLAAATQRVRRIGLGSAIIQLGYENPFRLAEDLSTVDVLSGGRLQVGVSVGPPPFGGLIADYTDAGDGVDYGYGRAERLARALRSEPLSGERLSGNAAGAQIPRLRPYAAGLADRLWYGVGSQRSAAWAAQEGFNFLSGNIVHGDDIDDFSTAQLRLIERFRRDWTHARAPRLAIGRVILPTDSLPPAKARHYTDFAAARHERTLAPQGERRTLFAPDIVGTSAEVLDALRRDPVIGQVTELRLELPYDFEVGDYAQILADFAALLPELRPAGASRAEPTGREATEAV